MAKKVPALLAIILVAAFCFLLGRYSVHTAETAALTSQKTTEAETTVTPTTETTAEADITATVQTEPAAGKETSSEYISHEAYRELFTLYDYGDKVTYVIGHKTPDADTVTSAIAMAELLNQLGIRAEPRITSDINKETAYAFAQLGIETPQILDNAAGCQLWLVDHSEYSHAVDGAEEADIVGITDHHGIGDVKNAALINISSGNYGSTSAEVYRFYKECGIEISKKMARVMLTGLISDTSNLKTRNDVYHRNAYDELLSIAEIDDVDALVKGMSSADYDYSGMSETDIYYADYKSYAENGYTYGIGLVKTAEPGDVMAMAERMRAECEKQLQTSAVDFLFYNIYDKGYNRGCLGCVAKDKETANKLLNEAFADIDKEMYDGYMISSPSLNRKAVIVPSVNKALSSWPYDEE